MINLLGATVAAIAVVGAPSEATSGVKADPLLVKAAVDYCLAVAEADVTGAAAIAVGPDGFERLEERYGAHYWLSGRKKEAGSIVASPGSGRMCTVIANDFAPDGIAPWFSMSTDYFPANEHGNGFVRTVQGGWVQIGWSREEFNKATMIIVQAIKETD